MALDHLQALADYIKGENVSHISVPFFFFFKSDYDEINTVARFSGLRRHSPSHWFIFYEFCTQVCTEMAIQSRTWQ